MTLTPPRPAASRSLRSRLPTRQEKACSAFLSALETSSLRVLKTAPTSPFRSSTTAVTGSSTRFVHLSAFFVCFRAHPLRQCADLTLSANASTPSNSSLQCQAASNVPLASAVPSGTAEGDSTASATAPAGSSTTKGNGASGFNVPVWSSVLGFVTLIAASL
jgi:hypothetical protein